VRGARPDRALEETLERGGIVRRGERAIVACSGGADSVALAAALAAIAKPMDLGLALVHVNHGTRRSAWQDECVAARIAVTLDLPLDVVALAPGAGGEGELRATRYDALASAARRFRATTAFTAHHAEDQSETVLLALFRGAGPEGVAGMRARRPLAGEIELARPLLRTRSETLRAYCHARALPYCVDPTNADLELRRNAVRDVLERIRPLFANLDESIARAAELAGAELESHPRAGIRRRVRERLGAEGELGDVDFAHVEAAVRAIERGRSGSFLMKTGVRLEIESGTIAGITKG